MKKALVIVSDNLKYNTPFVEYISREAKRSIGDIDSVYYIDEHRSDLFLTIEDIISKYEKLLIVTNFSFNLIGKILSTISEDNLELKDGQLIPSRSVKFTKKSFLVEYKGVSINLLEVKEGEELPVILLEDDEDELKFFLVDVYEKRHLELLDELKKIYSLTVKRTSLIEGLEQVVAKGFLLDQKDAFIKALAFGFNGKILFGDDLSQIVAQRLIESGKSITMMESCTGGLIASELTKHSGVSSIFNGSVVSYANEIKEKFGVSRQTLVEYGAVSIQTVHEMLEGALKEFQADFSIAVSGVAGPGGGSKEKPVGTVFVGAKCRSKNTLVEKLELKGDRNYIQKMSMLWAFKLVILSDEKLFFNFSLKSLDN